MLESTACDRARPRSQRPCYCDRCDLLVGLEGFHVIDVDERCGSVHVVVETSAEPIGCRSCGVVAHSHGRRDVRLIDVPCFGRPVRLIWRKRTWRCGEEKCSTNSFTEQHEDLARPRALLTVRACWWAINQLRREHASVAGLARQLGTTWRTVWRSIKPLLEQLAADPGRFEDVSSLGVDEHIWHHVSTRPIEEGGRGPKELTGMVDLTKDPQGRVRARLLDLVPGRSGKAYADWLQERGETFRQGVKVAALDPFQGYKTAIDDTLEDAVAVLDAFHIVKLGTAAVDECRRRIQQETLGHRGRKGDPLYGIQNLLRAGAEKLTDKHWRLFRVAVGVSGAPVAARSRPERGRGLQDRERPSCPTGRPRRCPSLRRVPLRAAITTPPTAPAVTCLSGSATFMSPASTSITTSGCSLSAWSPPGRRWAARTAA